MLPDDGTESLDEIELHSDLAVSSYIVVLQ